MDRKEIMQTIKELSMVQGFYTRMYNELQQLERVFPDDFDAYMSHLENLKIPDRVALVIYLESGTEYME